MNSFATSNPAQMDGLTSTASGNLNDTDAMSWRHPTLEYTYRVPTPPRIVLPPPVFSPHKLTAARPLAADPQTAPSFLQDLDHAVVEPSKVNTVWNYEDRRRAQDILPFLYLGPTNAAKDREWLRKQGITMVLAVRHMRLFEVAAFKVADELGLEKDYIEVKTNQKLISSFDETTSKINQHLSRVFTARQHILDDASSCGVVHSNAPSTGKVLVFCETGNERSAAVVGAYLMATFDGVDHIKAMQLCQAKRFCVNFDDDLKQTLRNYWDVLQAQRSVAAAKPTLTMLSNTVQRNARTFTKPSHKRTFSKRYDGDDMDVDGEDDVARFADRPSVAPFNDLS